MWPQWRRLFLTSPCAAPCGDNVCSTIPPDPMKGIRITHVAVLQGNPNYHVVKGEKYGVAFEFHLPKCVLQEGVTAVKKYICAKANAEYLRDLEITNRKERAAIALDWLQHQVGIEEVV